MDGSVIALGVMVSPAISGLMSRQITDDAQGELQGVLNSVIGITMIINPILVRQLFGYFSNPDAIVCFPGAPFFAAAWLTRLTLLPFVLGIRRQNSP